MHIARALGLELPGTVVFDYPTIDALALFAALRMDARQPAQQPLGSALIPHVVPSLAADRDHPSARSVMTSNQRKMVAA